MTKGGIYIPVYATAYQGNYLYAASKEGLKRAPATGVNLADYRNWELLSGKNGLPPRSPHRDAQEKREGRPLQENRGWRLQSDHRDTVFDSGGPRVPESRPGHH